MTEDNKDLQEHHGQDGRTPLRGIDYWTTEDKTEIINEIDNKVQNNLQEYYKKTETYNKEEIDNKISLIPKFDIEIVDKLPTSNISEATVYLVKSGEESQNLYTEYIYINGKWEQLGTQKLDLSVFYNKNEINSMLATRDSKIQALENENKSQAKKITALENENKFQQEEIDMLTADYRENTVEGETAIVTDGLPKSKVKVTVNGNSYQETTEGYQLFNKDDEQLETNKGKYMLNGKVQSNQYYTYLLIDNVKPNTNYKYIGANSVGSNDNITVVLFDFYNGETYEKTSINQNKTTNTITTSENCTKMYVSIPYADKDTFMIYEGTEEKPYEPYTGGQASPNTEYPSEIEVITECSLVQRGKNIFVPTYKVDDVSISIVNATLTLTDDEYQFTATGKDLCFGQITSKGNGYVNSRGTLYNVKGKSKIYLLLTNSELVSNYITAYDSNKISLGFSPINSYRGSYNIPEGAEYITLRIGYSNATVGKTYKTKVMLSFEEINNIFEPYHEPIVHSIDLAGNSLAKVGDVKDLLKIGVDGKVNLLKNTVDKILDSNWNWTINATTDTYVEFMYVGLNPKAFNGYKNAISNYFSNKTDNRIITNSKQILIRVPILSNITTLEQWKAFLTDNAVKVMYKTEDKQTIPLPSIEPITLFEGTNVFELITNLGTTFTVTYKVSNKSRLEALENAILSLGGNV